MNNGRRFICTLNSDPEYARLLASELLDTAEEFKESIPDGLYLKLADLSKAHYDALRPDDQKKMISLMSIIQQDRSMQRQIISNQERIISELEEISKNDEATIAMQKSIIDRKDEELDKKDFVIKNLKENVSTLLETEGNPGKHITLLEAVKIVKESLGPKRNYNLRKRKRG